VSVPQRQRPAQRRLGDAERGAQLVRQSAADDVEQFQRQAHEQHRAARAEILRITEQAQRRSEEIRAEAQDSVTRARAEVAVLAARRDAITTQLGDLSGVIDALAVGDFPSPEATDDSPLPLPTPHSTQHQEH